MPIDNFPSVNISASDPANGLVDLYAQKSDTIDLQAIPRALYCPTDGNIKITDKDGNTNVVPVFAGMKLELRIKRLWSTNTTVTSLFGLY